MILHDVNQPLLFPAADLRPIPRDFASTTFADNAALPVHRWIRFSAGFSAVWAESVIRDAAQTGPVRVFDPFAGSGTTLLAAENVGVDCWGVEAHPFVFRIGQAKLAYRSDPEAYRHLVRRIRDATVPLTANVEGYPPLIRKCYDDATLSDLDVLRQALEGSADGSPASELAWLTLIAILRKVSPVNTAQWQYILPRKTKKNPARPFSAFDAMSRMIYSDMQCAVGLKGPPARLLCGDARDCGGLPRGGVTLVVTSPPYPNNYDYADATRLEMSFMGEIRGWGDLQHAVRRHLIRSCTQHVPDNSLDLEGVLMRAELDPIRAELSAVCQELGRVRLARGGRKTYHLMVACYFLDLARVWRSLRSVCASPSRLCFVIGDSAPYGVYVPVMNWLGELALAAGFHGFRFERTRDRNTKWKNRKHRVPLCEGRLWVGG